MAAPEGTVTINTDTCTYPPKANRLRFKRMVRVTLRTTLTTIQNRHPLPYVLTAFPTVSYKATFSSISNSTSSMTASK
jgi:hypothetical protein